MKLKSKVKKRKAELKNLNQLPGKVIYIGNRKNQSSTYELIRYNKAECELYQSDKLEEIITHQATDKVNWFTITGLTDTRQIEAVGHHFRIHPLVLEDVVNTRQRPKLDEYEDYLFLVFKIGFIEGEKLREEHISLIVGQDYILSFQERSIDHFEKMKKRLKNDLGKLRERGADYLLYGLLDLVIDAYFFVVDELGNQLEEIENTIFIGNADEKIAHQIQGLKPEIFSLRRAVLPLRDMTLRLEKTNHKLILERNYNYFRDLHDNSLQVIENVEMYREMLAGIMEMYISTLNNKMNEVMKMLTIVATIFIPLTFIAGVYGMNFENMPELNFKYGYYVVLGVMLLIITLMIWYFKRKKWL